MIGQRRAITPPRTQSPKTPKQSVIWYFGRASPERVRDGPFYRFSVCGVNYVFHSSIVIYGRLTSGGIDDRIESTGNNSVSERMMRSGLMAEPAGRPRPCVSIQIA